MSLCRLLSNPLARLPFSLFHLVLSALIIIESASGRLVPPIPILGCHGQKRTAGPAANQLAAPEDEKKVAFILAVRFRERKKMDRSPQRELSAHFFS